MHRPSPRTSTIAAVLVAVLASACGPAPASTTPPSVAASASAAPSSAPASDSASASPSPAASLEPSASATEAASPAASGFPTAFTVAPNAEADGLFEEPDSCRNPQDGYVLDYPDPWYTNTEIRDVPACSWFSPTFYEVDDFATRPDEIAIEIFWIEGGHPVDGELLTEERGIAGGQYATRVESEGTPEDPTSGRSYEYIIQLGRTSEQGPNLVARTDTSMGGDYELNKAILDRIVASIEFLGSTQ
ncbi:MAG TPA: hypothetical protein VF367_00205 [Candidatus Limnocylindria bacterium]|jgi:hypothetical protein